MKVFVVETYKKNGPLRLVDRPEPQIGANDVLARILAAGVNPLDSKIRDGEFKLFLPFRLPQILGHELAGTVVRVGANVRSFKAGDEVFSRPRDRRNGTFAEFIAVDQADLALKPASLSMEQAASIPLVGLTAWQAWSRVARSSPDKRCSFRPALAGLAPLRSSLPGILVRRSPPRPVRRMPIWSEALGPMS